MFIEALRNPKAWYFLIFQAVESLGIDQWPFQTSLPGFPVFGVFFSMGISDC